MRRVKPRRLKKRLDSVDFWCFDQAVAQKPETSFRKKVVQALKTFPKTYIISISQRSIRGTPDLLVCIQGHFVALEIKSSLKASISELQRHALQKILEAEGVAFIIAPENAISILSLLKRMAFGETKIFSTK
jgi:hypothetical protein